MIKPWSMAYVMVLIIPLLYGCAAVVVGGVTAGVSLVHERRSTGTVIDDEGVELKVRNLVDQNQDLASHSRVSATSFNGLVLLTGQTDSPEARDRIGRLTHDLPKVRRIENYITAEPFSGLGDDTNDAYLTTRVKTALFNVRIPDFDPTRVKVVTERAVVYLMGLVTVREAAAAVEEARYVPGVRKVVKVFEIIQDY
ncbi:MAG: BON domain-containing protein [Pseudomonadota bacterium]